MQTTETNQKEVHRGEIYFYSFPKQEGSVQFGLRPCVVVSNEKNNELSTIVNVIPLTTQPKNPLPTHVYINVGSVYGNALAEQIMTIPKSRLRQYCGEIDSQTQKKSTTLLLYSFLLICKLPVRTKKRT